MRLNQNIKTTTVLVMCLLVSLAGCQTSQSMKAGAMDNVSFMDLWKTYSHCQAGSDLEGLSNDAVTLASAANHAVAQESFVLPLPKKLEEFVSQPTTRLAVDVKAMSAACSLRAGQAAVEVQRFDIARELLHGILEYHPESDYAFYSVQAKAILSELEPTSIQVSLSTPHSPPVNLNR